MEGLDRNLADWLENLIRRYSAATQFPREGRWREMSPDELWIDLVLAITYIGGSRPGERLRDGPDIAKLNLRGSELLTAEEINGIFADYGIRYVARHRLSWKARAVFENRRNPAIVRDERFVLFDNLPRISGAEEPRARLSLERKARRAVMQIVDGFGIKTASDYLTGRGYAKHLAVMDVRVSKIIARKLGGDPHKYTATRFFGEWEDFLVSVGLESAVVDRVLYQNYRSIMEGIAPNRNHKCRELPKFRKVVELSSGYEDVLSQIWRFGEECKKANRELTTLGPGEKSRTFRVKRVTDDRIVTTASPSDPLTRELFRFAIAALAREPNTGLPLGSRKTDFPPEGSLDDVVRPRNARGKRPPMRATWVGALLVHSGVAELVQTRPITVKLKSKFGQ